MPHLSLLHQPNYPLIHRRNKYMLFLLKYCKRQHQQSHQNIHLCLHRRLWKLIYQNNLILPLLSFLCHTHYSLMIHRNKYMPVLWQKYIPQHPQLHPSIHLRLHLRLLIPKNQNCYLLLLLSLLRQLHYPLMVRQNKYMSAQ